VTKLFRFILVALFLTVPSACDQGGAGAGGGAGGAGGSANEPTSPTVTLQLDEANAARATIGRDGGSLAATGADGTRFQLEVPAGALAEDTEIGIVPVAAIPDLPLGAQRLAAVQFEPDGLSFVAIGGATLTIELPSAPVAPFGFGWEGAGEDFHLRLQQNAGTTLTFDVLHFSGVGAAEGDGADFSDAAEWSSSAFENEFGNQAGVVSSEFGPDPFDDPAFQAKILDLLRDWYRFGVRPKVDTGSTADAFYTHGAHEALAWLNAQSAYGFVSDGIWGVDSDPLATENTLMRQKLADGFVFKVDRIVGRCEVTEDIVTYLQEAIDHNRINSALGLVDPPSSAREDAFLPHFEGRCIEVEVVEIEAPVWLAPGKRDTIEIWTGWSGPSGVLHHDAYAVGVELDASGGSLSDQYGETSTSDGSFSTEITMSSDVAEVTVSPYLEPGVYYGDPFTFTIGECESVHPGELVWPAIFDGDWDLTLDWDYNTCVPGSECTQGDTRYERTFSPQCGHRIATGGHGHVAVPGGANVALTGSTLSWNSTGTRPEPDCDPPGTYAISMTGSYTTDGETITGTRHASYTGLCRTDGVGGISGSWTVITNGTRKEP